MQYVKSLFPLLFLLPFTMLLVSCDDNDVTGVDDPSEVPSLPNFNQMQMETGIFNPGGGGTNREYFQRSAPSMKDIRIWVWIRKRTLISWPLFW